MTLSCIKAVGLILQAIACGSHQCQADGSGDGGFSIPAAVAPPAESQGSARSTEPPLSQPSNPQVDDEPPAVVVTGKPERGSVVGSIPPERTITPLEISTYNATDLGSLIQNLGPQATSLRGGEESAPVVLLNGRRISSFAEIARIPTEAIQRMEVFPEELALAYGFQPNQKVVNVVTFASFMRGNLELGASTPTEGGRLSTQYAGSFLRIVRNTRFSADASFSSAGALLESDRSLTSADGDLMSGDFRSLLPRTERIALNGTVARTLGDDLSLSLNGRYSDESNTFLLGLDPLGPVSRVIGSDILHVGAGVNGRSGRWTWSATANHDRSDIVIDTRTGVASSLKDRNALANRSSSADVVLNGPVATLPAGRAAISLRAGVGALSFRGDATTGSGARRTDLGRDIVSVQGSLQVPITSARFGPAWLGKLSANANGSIENLSDVGLLQTYGAGLNWQPDDSVSLFASYRSQERAPGVEQLGAPLLITPVLGFFDLASGRTLDIVQVSGGNTALRPEVRIETSIGVSAQPLDVDGLQLNLNYIAADVSNPITNLSFVGSGLEAVFPGRFERDSAGTLFQIDVRPVNFSEARQRTLRTGLTFTRQLTKTPPVPENTTYSKVEVFPSEEAMRASLPPGMTVVQVAPGSEGYKRLDSLRSRFTLALFHSWKLTDEITPRAGGPTFGVLDGFATDIRALPRRHQVDLQAGLFQKWYGARVTVDWRSRSEVSFQAPGSSGIGSDLTLPSYGTLSFSVFANPADALGGADAPAWLRGLRIELSVTNLLNERPRIIDGVGVTPIAYQPALLDPLGRNISLRLRKIL